MMVSVRVSDKLDTDVLTMAPNLRVIQSCIQGAIEALPILADVSQEVLMITWEDEEDPV